MVCPPHVLVQLQNRGLIPTNVTPTSGSAYHYGKCSLKDDEGVIREWEEPIYGTRNSYGYQGFDIPQHSSINDHCGHMIEIVECDGVLWKLTRVIHSQPYCSPEECQKNIETLQQIHNVRLTVTEDDLSWYSNHSRLCVMVHNKPMLFRDFRRSFRYWLILHIRIDPHSGMRRMHDNFFPVGLEQPNHLFFDIIECADFNSVQLGVDASVTFSSVIFEDHISNATMSYMKIRYKQWVWENCGVRPSWILPLLVARYIAHLRFIIALKASYAPVRDSSDDPLRPPKQFRDDFEADFVDVNNHG